MISQIPKSDGGDKRAGFCKSEQVVFVQFCVFYRQGSVTDRQRQAWKSKSALALQREDGALET